MKTRTIVIACFCIFCLQIGSAKGFITATDPEYLYKSDNLPPGYTEIELKGKLNCNPGPNDIEAGANDNSVYIHFNSSFGLVSISIYNESGFLVSRCVLDTATQGTVIIPISITLNGNFSVVLDNDYGSVEGDFEHN